MKQVISIVCVLFFASAAFAEAGFQFAAPGVRAPDDPEVSGMRFSVLYGVNQSMRGLDVGLLSMSETSSMSGLALIGGVHKVTTEMSSGVSFSLMNYHTSRDSGVNGAFINVLNDTSGAFNTGFFILAKGATLVDLGGINMSQSSKAQIGFLNITQEIHAFQFGFLNMAKNGFLPIFPIVNFPKPN